VLILAVIGAVGFFLGALLWVEQAPSPSRFVAPYSGTELVDAVMAMGLLAFLFHVYRARSMSFYHRLQESKERLRAMASTDVLTGLLNARAYYERCDQFLLATRRKRSPFAVLFIDLDHFKAINDQHGHATGDVVLQCVGRLIAQSVRQSDLAGRIGGEEFAVLLPDTDAQGLLPRRCAAPSRQPEAQGLRLSISASIGVALGGMAEQNMQDIQHQADLAMYEAKAAGRNRVTLFKPPQAVPNPLAAG
jgi:diguanylate cyclase (GGDEF)-like protein